MRPVDESTRLANSWSTTPWTVLTLFAVLVAYPGFRMAVAYFDLFPDPGGPAGWWSLWGVMLVGHWLCAALVLVAVAAEPGSLNSLGLDLGFFRRRGPTLLALVVLACVTAYVAPDLLYGDSLPERMRSHPLGPVSAAQRVFWVVMALTAGFVEELVYRGYAITRLRRLAGLPAALGLSLASFALMHGPSAFEPPLLTLYLVSGGIFSLLFLRWGYRRLEVLIALHAGLDLMLVALP